MVTNWLRAWVPWLPTLWLGQYRLWPRPDLKWDKYYFVANKRKIFGEQQKIFSTQVPTPT